ncbi:hypothetical protein PF005_g5800 [Phytophthora fragariae]|uniref:Fibronectin type III-like domain-containing protein n=1 Tax=Phytophthora fragariae TaxID=53985 RepID=A0A6A3LL72_9STRA|nr:hypothetical protein PF003_g684 [Phytophthora fragariae]KAE8942972.1 hypothetical protein PF009_g7297 [Phytophthora fragariae]KAE9018955.1 hypothetical protein PF011_g6040 [Phytophthora fragariae]KAE9120019.1 hypothetical protein PF007_g8326 [Phytophthora fragariae]KAE9124856.1 hypothetical protein PF010_g5854 [Phytophthora fragariae]
MERVDTRSGNATFSEGLNNSYRWYVYTKTIDAAATYPDAKFAAIVLVGFAYVVLESGAITTVSIGIREKHLSFYNLNTTSW